MTRISTCYVCFKKYTNSFRAHMLTHANGRNRIYKCKYCSIHTTFASISNMYSHLRKYHTKRVIQEKKHGVFSYYKLSNHKLLTESTEKQNLTKEESHIYYDLPNEPYDSDSDRGSDSDVEEVEEVTYVTDVKRTDVKITKAVMEVIVIDDD